MCQSFKKIFGINICYDAYDAMHTAILTNWKTKGWGTIGFMYFSNLVDINKDEKLKSSYKAYDMVLPDGVGLQIYAKKVFNTDLPNLNGTDYIPVFLKKLDELGIDYHFYGSTKENIKLCQSKFNVKSVQDGYGPIDFSKISEGSVLLIGLGIRNHEKFIEQNKEIIAEKKLLVVSVGGLFDFFSGTTKRAPSWIRQLKVEFLYRLAQDPKKHFKKNVNNFYVIYYILRDRFLAKQ